VDKSIAESFIEHAKHRFLGYFRRTVDGEPSYVYRCVCGYIEAAPINGGPARVLSANLKPQANARRLVAHLHLERAHELN
jgi:hypothetical protein